MRVMVGRLVLAWTLSMMLVDAAWGQAAGLGRPQIGPTTTQQAVDQITRSVTRPLPPVAPPVVVPPSSVWVPEHFTAGDVHVPAHWEHRLPDGSLYVPPLVIFDPRTGERLVPGHVQTAPLPEQTP